MSVNFVPRYLEDCKIMIRQEIRKLIELGSLPDSDADAESIDQHGNLLEIISPPVNDEEARELIKLFGPDDCYGLAWALIHLIESAPGWPLEDCLQDSDQNRWLHLLRTRLDNARQWVGYRLQAS